MCVMFRRSLELIRVFWTLRVLPGFSGHLITSYSDPEGCHDTATQVYGGVQAGSGRNACRP
jgi:hypothetical protein